jgi:hypothetical protein
MSTEQNDKTPNPDKPLPPPWTAKLAEMREQHPRALSLAHPTIAECWAIANPPSRVALAAYLDSAEKFGDKQRLILDCVIYPDKPAMDALFSRHPGAVVPFAAALAIEAGISFADVRGK